MSPIGVGNGPQGIAITPDGQTAYVSDDGDGTVTAIDLAAGTTSAITIRHRLGISQPGAMVAITPDQAPTASFSDVPGIAGRATAFDASASTTPQGTITSYACNPRISATAPRPRPRRRRIDHTYARGGAFTATLTVTDSAGTSTAQVFTGQSVSNNGGASAATPRW